MSKEPAAEEAAPEPRLTDDQKRYANKYLRRHTDATSEEVYLALVTSGYAWRNPVQIEAVDAWSLRSHKSPRRKPLLSAPKRRYVRGLFKHDKGVTISEAVVAVRKKRPTWKDTPRKNVGKYLKRVRKKHRKDQAELRRRRMKREKEERLRLKLTPKPPKPPRRSPGGGGGPHGPLLHYNYLWEVTCLLPKKYPFKTHGTLHRITDRHSRYYGRLLLTHRITTTGKGPQTNRKIAAKHDKWYPDHRRRRKGRGTEEEVTGIKLVGENPYYARLNK